MDAAERKKLNKIIEESRLPWSTQNTHRFGTFTVNDDNREAFEVAANYEMLRPNLTSYYVNADGSEPAESDGPNAPIEEWPGSHPFLTLVGPTGTGKTHLAIAIAWNEIFFADQYIRYWQVEELLDALRSTFSENDHSTYDRIMWDCKHSATLILDDLGAEQGSEWARARLDLIIDARYLEGLQLVVTTNCNPEQLSPRIASRLREGEVVVMTGKDFRLLKAQRRTYERQAKKKKMEGAR